MKKMENVIILGIVLILIVGAGSFFGGMKYGQSKGLPSRQDMAERFGGANGGQPGQRNANGKSGGFVTGEIISKDEKSITIKTPNNGSKIVSLSSSTTITKSTDGTAGDLENGKTVMVSGTTNTDGTVTAQNVQIRPANLPAPDAQAPQDQTKK